MNKNEEHQLNFEYDKRQLNLMKYKIKAFLHKKLYIDSLINDLSALLNVLTFDDKEWRRKFIYQWGYLEQVYAVAIDEEKRSFDFEDWLIIDKAIMNLDKMINEKLLEFDKEK